MPSLNDKSGFDRRRFLSTVATGAALVSANLFLGPAGAFASGEKKQDSIELPKLPWEANSLEPYISARTISFHYGKHHAGYVRKINKFIKGTPYENMPLAKIIVESAGKPDQAAVFNNAAQVWNHTFYWKSMKPGGGGAPQGELLNRIKNDFGGYDEFKKAFAGISGSQFGSGWGWLVLKDGKLSIMKTSNAENPSVKGYKPLLTVDVWEHAYYIDYQNRRGDYLAAFLDHLVNWEFAEKNMKI